MVPQPEQKVTCRYALMPRAHGAQERPRKVIDKLLAAARWLVCGIEQPDVAVQDLIPLIA